MNGFDMQTVNLKNDSGGNVSSFPQQCALC